jgi:hypothetical protein
VTGSFSLADLLQLRIGEEPVPSASSGYNEKCYIDRTLITTSSLNRTLQLIKEKENMLIYWPILN